MFKAFKKLSLRMSARQIEEATLGLISALLPFEAKLAEIATTRPQPAQLEDAFVAAIIDSTKDPQARAAAKTLQWELLGPIPIDSVRDDIIVPICERHVPRHMFGVVVRKAISEVLSWAMHPRRDVAGIGGLWAEVNAARGAARTEPADPRFIELAFAESPGP